MGASGRRPGSIVWIVVTARGVSRGKTRLKGVLDDTERWRLNRRLLASTLAAASGWRPERSRCVVISPCPRALRLARASGVLAWREPRVPGGLNAAATRALRSVAASGGRRVVLLPTDLPMLDTAALDALANAAGAIPASRMILVPDRAGTGTNAMYLRSPLGMRTRYGENSLSAHRAAAAARGWTTSLLAHPALATDLDTPADLQEVFGGRLQGAAASAIVSASAWHVPTTPRDPRFAATG